MFLVSLIAMYYIYVYVYYNLSQAAYIAKYKITYYLRSGLT